jgi:hypothetical protein
MKKKIRLTESELIRLIKRIIEEEKYSEEDIKYTHPMTGEACKIKVARNKLTSMEYNQYGSILVCVDEEYGDDRIEAELPVNGSTSEEVSDFICENIERTFELLDDMLTYEEEEPISEEVYSQRWDIIDQPIVCSDKPKKKKSWEY